MRLCYQAVMESSSAVLITGSSGLIGSALVRVLGSEGFTRLLTPSHDALELRDGPAVKAYFSAHAPEYVFHLAARVGGIHANKTYPGQFIYDNTAMQLNVFEAARLAGVKKILFPGSACTYPRLAPQPVKESEFLNGSIEPTNIAYGAAKVNGIVLAQSYAREYGLKAVIPMPTNAYGIGDNFNPEASHVIPALMQRFFDAKLANLPEVVIWGSGNPLREFIYADDVADAFVFLMRRHNSPEIINVGSGQEISIKDLAHKIAGITGYLGKIAFDTEKPDGSPRKILDSLQLFALGWRPKLSLDEGLKRMFENHFIKKNKAA
jgi:GDP-L-fucose synthase